MHHSRNPTPTTLIGNTLHQGRWWLLPSERSTLQDRWLALLVENLMGSGGTSSSSSGGFFERAHSFWETESARADSECLQKKDNYYVTMGNTLQYYTHKVKQKRVQKRTSNIWLVTSDSNWCDLIDSYLSYFEFKPTSCDVMLGKYTQVKSQGPLITKLLN